MVLKSRIRLTITNMPESPNRFREVNARDLTGAVQPVHLLPTSRTETCDIWKAEWTGSFGKRKVCFVQFLNPLLRLRPALPQSRLPFKSFGLQDLRLQTSKAG